MKRLAFSLGIAVELLMASTAVFAHHGADQLIPDPAEVVYAGKNPVTLNGSVTVFRFYNPHVSIRFEVKDAQGKVVTWTAETDPPQRMYRAGWRKDSLKPGDKVTVIGTPVEGGAKHLIFRKLVAPGGLESGSYDPATQ